MGSCEGEEKNKSNPYKNQEMMIISFLVYNTCQLLKIGTVKNFV